MKTLILGTKSEECPKGSYCTDGIKHLCPKGTFGATVNLPAVENCTQCTGGRYCQESGKTLQLAGSFFVFLDLFFKACWQFLMFTGLRLNNFKYYHNIMELPLYIFCFSAFKSLHLQVVQPPGQSVMQVSIVLLV